MPENLKESKAKKLAAARKKLKEYQQRGNEGDTSSNTTKTEKAIHSTLPTTEMQQTHPSMTTSTSSCASYEKSDSELNLNSNVLQTLQIETESTDEPYVNQNSTNSVPTVASYFNGSSEMFSKITFDEDSSVPFSNNISEQQLPQSHYESKQNLDAFQVLITEKSQLTSELNKYRTVYREKDLELEELRMQYTTTVQRLEDLQASFKAQQQYTEQVRNTNAELQHKLAQSNAVNEDQTTHINELKKQLEKANSRANELEERFKEKNSELEMTQICIRQLSDEANLTNDNRVESLTQTQFMYEQQIRDLQAMVQQLTQDKEQANKQYQNYTEHLNAHVNSVNEKNSELLDECAKLQQRERQLVDHISELEREIQKNISLHQREEKKQDTSEQVAQLANEIEKLKETVSDFEFERHEFQLKIKSQEDRLVQLNAELEEKKNELLSMHEHFENVSAEQHDRTKLLTTMESDKIAASRALAQNIELKKQLDEIEMRFVQLTNDKADLVNKFDAELYANREMRTNYAAMEERLQDIDKRFKFKDEEMIRLSHENMDLKQEKLELEEEVYFLKHEVQKYDETTLNKPHQQYSHITADCCESDTNGHEHACEHEHDHKHNHDHKPRLSDEHMHDDHKSPHNIKHKHRIETGQEAIEIAEEQNVNSTAFQTNTKYDASSSCISQNHIHNASRESHNVHDTPNLATSEAVEKLQQRFTQLISQVADLTEEKQRLEHLVLQLQGETETIGEYIALYQTQRRMLKEREYEKAAQMKLLQQEREQMSQRIAILNNLVSSLGLELPNNEVLHDAPEQNLSSTTAATASAATGSADIYEHQSKYNANENIVNEKLNTLESKAILNKIQDIITEMKENTKEISTIPHTVDHLNCCLGKFEVV